MHGELLLTDVTQMFLTGNQFNSPGITNWNGKQCSPADNVPGREETGSVGGVEGGQHFQKVLVDMFCRTHGHLSIRNWNPSELEIKQKMQSWTLSAVISSH